MTIQPVLPTVPFPTEDALKAFLRQSLPPTRQVPDRPEEIVVPVHFILPTTDEEWFIATYFDFGAPFWVIGLWKATLPQFGGGVYAMGSIDLWQLTRPRDKGSVMLDTTWTPQTLATVERRLKQQHYRPRQEVPRLY